MRWIGHLLFALVLTALTQLGGLAWLGAVALGRRWLSFPLLYAVLWGLAFVLAPLFGREALPCVGEPLRMQSPVYCVLMRNYVTPQMADVARDAARTVEAAHPGTVTLALDGNFPFVTGFPLPPHLSHDDGEKLDFAFYYQEDGAYLPGRTRAPLGYFAFEALEESFCRPVWISMRWDMRLLQPLLPKWEVDVLRVRSLTGALVRDERVSKIFVEPPLMERWGLRHEKVRFQGCRASRHDDHLHVQL